MTDDEKFMSYALREAKKAYEAGEVPVGCVIVKNGEIIGAGHNQVEMLKDATAHAEIIAIGVASSFVDNWRLDGATLYVTLEPCPMCAGAILNSRISKIVYGSKDSRFGACGTRSDVILGNALDRRVEVVGDILDKECISLLLSFFREMRAKKGDSGKKALPC